MAVRQVKPEGFIEEADRWEYLWFIHRQGRTVDGRVEKVTFPDNLKTAVWELDLDGVKGVVPFSETGLADQGLMLRFVGQVVRVKIAGLDRESRVAACSRREALAEASARLFAVLQPGQVIDVMVKAVLPPEDGRGPRIVVDVGGGVLVEVPRRLATTRQAERLEQVFRPGRQTKAEVTRVDKESGIIRVSLAAVEADPWQEPYRRGDVVAGLVVNQLEGVLFVEVKPGLVGIASAPLQGKIQKGERVACVVTVYNPKEKTLHLQLRGRLA